MGRPKLIICDRCGKRFEEVPERCPACGEILAARMDPGFKRAVERFFRWREMRLVAVFLGVVLVGIVTAGFFGFWSFQRNNPAGAGGGTIKPWTYGTAGSPFPAPRPGARANFSCHVQTEKSTRGEPDTYAADEGIVLILKVMNLDSTPTETRLGASGIPDVRVKRVATNELITRKAAPATEDAPIVSFEANEEKTFKYDLRTDPQCLELGAGAYEVYFTLPQGGFRSNSVTITIIQKKTD
jgi:hypothetical protein